MKTTEKLDLVKLHKNEYVTPKKPVLLEIKPATYLTIEGQGEPGGTVFSEKIEALYGIAYTIKMTRKFAGLGDYAVAKLEGLWWLKNGTCDWQATPKSEWCWKLMIRTPEFVTKEDLTKAAAALTKKGKSAAVNDVQIECLDEGWCVQMLHVGPYEQVAQTVKAMHEYAQQNGHAIDGRHHEIYLSDPRRVEPAKLKTILRQPVNVPQTSKSAVSRAS